jgi:hypothetical protein
MVIAIALVFLSTSPVGAVSGSDWRAGNIISDTEFTNKDAMSVQDIQSFLDNKIGSCDINGTQPASEYGRPDITHAQYAASRGWPGPPYTCINRYYEVPKLEAGGDMPANNYANPDSIPSGAQSAAWIIKDAANRFNISPKVLLVKIATESAGPLTGDKWPLLSQYRYAMGSHCPDSGPGGSANCDPAYAGFSIQMYSAASLMRWYLDSMDQPWWSYKRPYQTNNILWNIVETGCGGGDVYIENKATAALYTYTPYQPNQAALNNLYGTGDGCSAYGNRNFWRVFWDWFGNPQIGEAGNAIAARYTEVNSDDTLGAARGNVTCGLKNGGCFQFYEKGAIMWSPATGAWESFGPIRTRYSQMEFENSSLGYPTGPVYCGIKDGGCYQPYQNGYIVGSSASGWWESKGAIRTRWSQLGFENGALGYPVTSEQCTLKNNGCFQFFQNGAIVGSPASGWWESTGMIRTEWSKWNFESGRLGYPVGAPSCIETNDKCTQPFQGGAIYYSQATGAKQVWGAILGRYFAIGAGSSTLGYPVTSEQCTLKNNGCFQFFQNGAIVGSPASGWWESTGMIREKWASLGFENGALGYPTGPIIIQGNSLSQTYQNNKKILYSPESGTTVQ